MVLRVSKDTQTLLPDNDTSPAAQVKTRGLCGCEGPEIRYLLIGGEEPQVSDSEHAGRRRQGARRLSWPGPRLESLLKAAL
ncbi:hypothetical protein CONPUDRAFT_161945, partial [Coniophora puteana RWD-64-598 SS2]